MKRIAQLVNAAVALVACAPATAAVVTLCNTHNQPAPPGVFNLLKAVQQGGVVTFQCGAATIRVTQEMDILRDVRIDGGGRITLDGANTSRMFNVRSDGVRFTLDRLTLVRGHVPVVGAMGGSLVRSGAASTIEISNSHLSDSPDAIFILGPAKLSIDHTQISSNNGSFITTAGGATVAIADSEIFGNGGAAFNVCTLSISRTRFTANHSNYGGAFQTGCATTLDHVDFVNNQATENGGAIYFKAPATTMKLRATTFQGNSAAKLGGAIALEPTITPHTIEIRYGTFRDNRAASGGAINLGNFIENDATLDAGAVLFERNIATGDGGAVAAFNARVLIRRGVFRANSAARGGGVALQLYAPRPSLLANVLMTGNHATSGSALFGSGVRILNSTIADNTGTALKLFGASPAPWRAITLVNTVLSGNSGGNCGPPAPPGNTYTIGARNLQYPDAACGATIPVGPPSLDPTYAPIAGGAAFAHGDAATCAAPEVGQRDVWGQTRPIGKSCSIGAVEGPIIDQLERRKSKESLPIRKQ